MLVPAPPQEVFRWFVRPELLVQWIGIDARLDPRPAGRDPGEDPARDGPPSPHP